MAGPRRVEMMRSELRQLVAGSVPILSAMLSLRRLLTHFGASSNPPCQATSLEVQRLSLTAPPPRPPLPSATGH